MEYIIPAIVAGHLVWLILSTIANSPVTKHTMPYHAAVGAFMIALGGCMLAYVAKNQLTPSVFWVLLPCALIPLIAGYAHINISWIRCKRHQTPQFRLVPNAGPM